MGRPKLIQFYPLKTRLDPLRVECHMYWAYHDGMGLRSSKQCVMAWKYENYISFSWGLSLTLPLPPNKGTSDPPLLGLTVNKSLENLAPWVTITARIMRN